jgi:hypothetical protein
MAFQKLMYRSAVGTITGNLAGKLIHFSARPGQGGGQPPPGNYDIHPPVNDPIYGMVALMTPSGGPNAGQAFTAKVFKLFATKEKETPASMFHKVEPAMKNCLAPAFKYCFAPKTNMADGGRFASVSWRTMKDTKSALSSPVFVLSSKPILGQNSLIVMVGHADLMDALQAAGGASVTVS